MIRWRAALLLALAACSDPLRSAPPIVARVDGEEITAPQLQRELRRLQRENDGAAPRSEDELGRVRRTLLDRLVDRALLLAEARKRALVVSREDVDKALARKRAGYPGAAFDEEVARTEMTRAELEQRVQGDLLVRRLVRAETDAATEVSLADARGYYDAHSDAFDLPERVHARQIVTKTEEHARQVKDALGQKGADFAALARRHSLSPDGKQGGDLGFFPRGVMPKVFDDVCFALQPGKVSDVVASTYGYHLFEVIERRPAQRRGFDEARGEIEALLGRARAAEAEAKFLAALREKARIKVDEDVLRNVR